MSRFATLKTRPKRRRRSSGAERNSDSGTWVQRLVSLLPVKMLTTGLRRRRPSPAMIKTMTKLEMSWSRVRRIR